MADFPEGTRFGGTVHIVDTERTALSISFSVAAPEAPAAQRISAPGTANLLNEFIAAGPRPPPPSTAPPPPRPRLSLAQS